MRKQTTTLGVIFVMAMIGLTGCSSISSSRSVLRNPQNHSTWQTLKDEPDISTFASLIKSAGLQSAMKTAGNYTVFAPINAAFTQLPKGTLKDLTKKINRNALRSLLWHHIALYQITATSSPVQDMADSQSVTIASNGRRILKVNGAKVVGGPIYTDDATVYMINKVLLPRAGK
jgi:uncharacterized surface protein with fasciclin (FAS1) repeats